MAIFSESKSAWTIKRKYEWLYFQKVDGLNVVGNEQGLIDGQGSSWWLKSVSLFNTSVLSFLYFFYFSLVMLFYPRFSLFQGENNGPAVSRI